MSACFISDLEEIVAAKGKEGDTETDEIGVGKMSVEELRAHDHEDDNLEVGDDGRVMGTSVVHQDQSDEEIGKGDPVHAEDDHDLCRLGAGLGKKSVHLGDHEDGHQRETCGQSCHEGDGDRRDVYLLQQSTHHHHPDHVHPTRNCNRTLISQWSFGSLLTKGRRGED